MKESKEGSEESRREYEGARSEQRYETGISAGAKQRRLKSAAGHVLHLVRGCYI